MESSNQTVKVGEFKERLKDILGDQSVRAFARACGLSEGVLRQYLSGQSEPTRLALLKMAEASGVTVEWLAVGTGAGAAGYAGRFSGGEDYVYIPRFNEETFAEEGERVETEQALDSRPFPVQEIQRYRTDPDNLTMIEVRGESMQPTLHPGDEVMVDLTAGRTIVDGIYAVRIDDTVMVKRIQHAPGRKFTLISDNPAYRPIEIDSETSDDFQIVGRALWVGRRF